MGFKKPSKPKKNSYHVTLKWSQKPQDLYKTFKKPSKPSF